MSSREFGEWLAYETMSPGEPLRSDYHAALIAMTVANAHRSKGRSFRLEDFLLRFRLRTILKKSAKEIKMKMTAWLKSSKIEVVDNRYKRKKHGHNH